MYACKLTHETSSVSILAAVITILLLHAYNTMKYFQNKISELREFPDESLRKSNLSNKTALVEHQMLQNSDLSTYAET